jgi:nicotinamide-nucleotide amidase
MFKNYAAAFLRQKTDGVFVSRTLKIIGMGETAVETELRDLIDTQTNPTIAPYAKVGEVHIRITASAPTEPAAQALLAPVADEIYSRMHPRVYAEDDLSLAETVLEKLLSQNHTLAIAESCTGGLVASNIVAVPGSSAVFREGFVTYSNEAKINRLSVPEDILENFGAVSPETAAAMAEGAAKAAGTTIGLSTTGIAGPDGGSAEKPVGLVYIGLYIEGRDTQTSRHNTIGNRNEVRTRSAILALDLLRRNL